ncbi:MAG: hypothetical protein LBH28_11610 [Oscillospiraceae bacterium]|jgi:hypothetical protein|nr:hypothetical protein [Oscillospiraceae bacterium]
MSKSKRFLSLLLVLLLSLGSLTLASAGSERGGGKVDVGTVNGGSVVIEKWVDGLQYLKWGETPGPGAVDLKKLAGLLYFELYKVTGYGAPFKPPPIAGVYLDENGMIKFENCITSAGWYVIVETLIDEAGKIFERPAPLYFYIDESLNFYGSDPLHIVSKEDDDRIWLLGGEVVEVANVGNTGIPYIVDFWKNNMTDFNKYFSKDAKFIWDTGDTFVYGTSGSLITVYIDLNVTAQQIRNGVTLNFACDNAAIIRTINAGIDKNPVAYTREAFAPPRKIEFNDLSDKNFIGGEEAWSEIESLDDISRYLRPGHNLIQIQAANSARTPEFLKPTGTPNDWYDETNNPCGLIFQLDGSGTVFENNTKKPGYVCEVRKGGDPPKEYFSLDAALETISPDEVASVRLLTNIDYIKDVAEPKAALEIDGKRDITFDMNGYNLNIVNKGSGRGLNVLESSSVRMGKKESGEMNVTGGSCGVFVAEWGKATVTNCTGRGSKYGIYVGDNASAEVKKDVTFETNDSALITQGCAAYAGKGSELAIGGNVNAKGTTAIGVYADGGHITVQKDVNAGKLIGKNGAAQAYNLGTVIVNGVIRWQSGTYITVDGITKEIGDYVIEPDYPTYYTYKNKGISSVVRVSLRWTAESIAQLE